MGRNRIWWRGLNSGLRSSEGWVNWEKIENGTWEGIFAGVWGNVGI